MGNISSVHANADLERVLDEVSDRHFFPRATLQKYLENYSAEELSRIFVDFVSIRTRTFSLAEKRPIYLATAGGPASGKTTLLEDFLKVSPGHFAYIDPDRSCLPHMRTTYKKDLSEGSHDLYGAYVYWRAASNFIANILLAIALKDGYAIAHGTTMTSGETSRVLKSLKEQYGYDINIWHLTCAEDVREQSLAKRVESGNLQCTPEDFRDKGVLFFRRLPDYLTGADKIVFYYRSKMDTVAIGGFVEGGNLIVRDGEVLDKIAEAHNLHDIDFKSFIFL